MENSIFIFGDQAEALSELQNVHGFLSLPNGSAQAWDNVQKADSADLWFFYGGTYPKDGERVDVANGIISPIIAIEDPLNLAEIVNAAQAGVCIQISVNKAREFGFWPEAVELL